jgi:hypothetical protein
MRILKNVISGLFLFALVILESYIVVCTAISASYLHSYFILAMLPSLLIITFHLSTVAVMLFGD